VIVDAIETWKRCPHPAFAFRRWYDNLMEAKYYKKTIGKVGLPRIFFPPHLFVANTAQGA
jgi:hypothetical protein